MTITLIFVAALAYLACARLAFANLKARVIASSPLAGWEYMDASLCGFFSVIWPFGWPTSFVVFPPLSYYRRKR